MDFLAVKVDGSDVKSESVKRLSCRKIPDLTSLPSTVTAKKYTKTTFSSDKIYYNFSEENPKITDILNPHGRYIHFNCRHMQLDVDFREGGKAENP